MRKERWGIFVVVVLVLGIHTVCGEIYYSRAMENVQEGLSDEELYGNGSENVLGKKAPVVTKQGQPEEVGKEKQQPEKSVKQPNTSQVEIKQEEEQTAVQPEESLKTENSQEESLGAEDYQEDSKIHIDGVEEQGYYKEPVNIQVQLPQGTQSDQVSGRLIRSVIGGIAETREMGVVPMGKLLGMSEEVNQEGDYKVQIQIQQEQEVIAQEQVEFHVDWTPPKMEYKRWQEMCRKKIDAKELQSTVKDSSPVKTEVLVNERSVEQNPVEQSGEYELLVRAVDAAGNQTQKQATVMVGGTEKNTQFVHAQKNKISSLTLAGLTLLLGAGLFVREHRQEKQIEEDE